MDFLQQVKKDIQQITTTGFATEIIFTTPGGIPYNVAGMAGKHSMTVNNLGFIQVNSKEAYCSITEQSLIDAGCVTRDSNGNLLTFAKYLATWTDVSGQTVTYIVQSGQSKADESVGLIVFILGNYKAPVTP